MAVTQHRVAVNGRVIPYKAHAGYMTLKNEKGEDQANVFFTAYLLETLDDPAKRPITFVFNGGPGSSSVWLHMGGVGPRRVLMTDEGKNLSPPYVAIDNEHTWLDKTDLVFIDPMMTGYSRPAAEIEKEKFLGYEEDVQLVGDFIRQFVSEYERWASPKFLAGESYGTTRAAGLAGYLQDRHGMYLNGLVLISAVLNFQTLLTHPGNDLPYLLHLPSFAATAWYHGKLDTTYKDLQSLLNEVEIFAFGEYTYALMKGDKLTPEIRQLVVDKLHAFTGLSKTFIERSNLRITTQRFTKELLREEGKTIGRLDSRFTGTDLDNAGERSEYDPSYDKIIYGPYTMAINDHIRRELKYKNPLPYEVLTDQVSPWYFGPNAENAYLNVAGTLRQAMNKNPHLKVLVCNGFYDLATPYFATEYTFNHFFLPADLQDNIRMQYYRAGHMMYIKKNSLIKLKTDVASFIREALN